MSDRNPIATRARSNPAATRAKRKLLATARRLEADLFSLAEARMILHVAGLPTAHLDAVLAALGADAYPDAGSLPRHVTSIALDL